MRRLIVAAMVAVSVQSAQAADLPDWSDLPVLRGAVGLGRSTALWQGYYVGGQYNFSSTKFGAPGAVDALNSFALNTSGLSNTVGSTFGRFDNSSANGFGGFVGYNGQWEDVVLGVDANYNLGGQQGAAVIASSVTTQTVNGVTYQTTTTGASSMKITDYGSLRGRAGWAFGSVLPYVTGGVALGRADLSRVVQISGVTDPGGANTPYGPLNGVQQKNGAFVYGYSYGGGVDIALFGGVFVRAEAEVTRFVNVWGMDATVTSGRVGAGYRF